MSILSIRNLGLSFGARDIFAGLHAELPHGSRAGLVGPNGVGKTSLFRILAGVMPATSGSVHLASGTRLGYLRQEAVEAFAGHEHTVYDEMLTVFAPVRAQADELRAMEERMAGGDVSEDLLLEYGALQEHFERGGGYDYDARIRRTLQGLGFAEAEWSTAMSHLSGGQKTRALLARLLLEQPTLLILDEPTNHLDVDAVEWLERALASWQGALLIASHDRYFLDQVVDHVWEMSSTHIETYTGNYSAYVKQREERWERNLKVYQSEMERIRREMELIRNYYAWRKFEEARGKLKRLSRELAAIEVYGLLSIQGKSWSEMDVHRVKPLTVEEAHDAVKHISPPPSRPPRLHLNLKPARRSGDIVLRTHDLRVGYPGKPLFQSDDIYLQRGERVALIGPNGAGKTTFLRTLLGQLPPLGGEIVPGASLHVGYFAQTHDSLQRENTVLDELLRHRNIPIPQARNHLASYLFRGEDVFKPVGALSGGERGRLALAILSLDGVNCLLLDEPTNHLDIPAREVLQEGLEQFDGTLIMVSHDRYLVADLASQIWELRGERLHVFKGTYAELMLERETREAAQEVTRRETRVERKKQVSGDKAERKRAQRVARLEEQIVETEREVADRGAEIEACDGSDPAELVRLTDEYAAAQRRLDALLEEWSNLAGDVDAGASVAEPEGATA